jgi:GNAT superfamily N-acetyltransferase
MAADDPDLGIEPIDPKDGIATWAEVYNRASPCRPEGVDELRHVFSLAPDWQAVIAWRGPEPVGVGQVEIQHWVPGSHVADAWIAVPKEHRRAGTGSALARALSVWAGERDLDALDVWVDQADPDAPGFWARRGYREVGRERISQVDLLAVPPPPVGVPDGVTLVTMDVNPDLEPGMFRVAGEGFADIPGPEPYDVGDFAHWRQGEIHKPGFMPELSVVALAGADVIGFATLVRYQERPDVAVHEMTVVAREWRGRGVAQAMKYRQITLACDTDLKALESTNEARNLPILAVNAGLGYVPVTDMLQLRGPLLV